MRGKDTSLVLVSRFLCKHCQCRQVNAIICNVTKRCRRSVHIHTRYWHLTVITSRRFEC